jgi:hypothetical protein
MDRYSKYPMIASYERSSATGPLLAWQGSKAVASRRVIAFTRHKSGR